jgi:hypothetical protein
MLRIDDAWLDMHVWLISSFTLAGCSFRMNVALLKLFLFLESLVLLSSHSAQVDIFWLALVFYTSYYFLRPPFRCWSSNLFLTCCNLPLVVTTTFGMLTGLQVRLRGNTSLLLVQAITFAAQ